MRHSATLIIALENLHRNAYDLARELAFHSSAGLTARSLAKKLHMPIEEIEFIVDQHPHLYYQDFSKIKLVPEGIATIKRIGAGLKRYGDVPGLFEAIRGLTTAEFRAFEEYLGIEQPVSRPEAARRLIDEHYQHPESLVEYVASNRFSDLAREVFDVVWQSDDGVVPVSALRNLRTESEFRIEEALDELFQGFALFELFRFDEQDQLVRFAAQLSELRKWRETAVQRRGQLAEPTPVEPPSVPEPARGLDMTERCCKLVAAIAAKPVRLRSDGELYREDRRRLSTLWPEDSEPWIETCLWVAQGAGWVAPVDNELRVTDLDSLVELEPGSRHKQLCDWLLCSGNEPMARGIFANVLPGLQPGAWYRLIDAVNDAVEAQTQYDQPVLRQSGGHWRYLSPSVTGQAERALARSLEETYVWLGLVHRAETPEGSIFTLTDLGRAYFAGEALPNTNASSPAYNADLLVQPNFEIMVPTGEIDPLLTIPLEQFCERVSTGAVTVYRLTKESFTRAVQEGRSGERFAAFLYRHHRHEELPGNVRQTLEDWRGSMKRVRLRTMHVIESDDPLVIVDLLHRRRLQAYVQAPDPNHMATVARISKSELIKGLEKEGFVVGK